MSLLVLYYTPAFVINVSINERLFVNNFQVGLTMLRYHMIFVAVVVIITRHTND